MKKIQNFINGQLVGLSESYLPVYDPSTGEVISEVILSNNKDFEMAIKSSKNAFLKWSEITPLKRSRILSKFKENIEKIYNYWQKLFQKNMEKQLKMLKVQ